MSSTSPSSTTAPVTPPLARGVVALIVLGALFRLALGAWVTDFVLVDDAYIHLRYARNLVQQGALEFNPGEAVFGVTSPSYVLLASLVLALAGDAVEVALVVLGIAAWTVLTWLVARNAAEGARYGLVAVLSFAPVFVDNQLLGMESALFGLLLVGALEGAQRGALTRAALCTGLAVVTRPEAVLAVPWLVLAAAQRLGVRVFLRALVRPLPLLALLGPGLAWAVFATLRYGTVIPQSLVAKSGWNNAHYAATYGFESLAVALPRLTFVPFVDHLPRGLTLAVAALTAGLVVLVGAHLARSGAGRTHDIHGRIHARWWFGFYATYLAFYGLGKGATEASWYAVPGSLALTLAAAPLLAAWAARARSPRVAAAWGLCAASLLAVASLALALRRAPLLAYYWEGYGRCAASLAEDPRLAPAAAHRVAIGEIGVFGFASPHLVTDIGALVSPEVLPWKNSGASFVEVVQRSGASAFVVSERALTTNAYPSLACTAADEAERAWLARCELVARHLDKRAYFVPEELRPTP